MTTVIKSPGHMQAIISQLKKEGKTIGLVPTMGALHAGHQKLMEESRKTNKITVVSIYVNPTQFNNLEDLEKYPKTLDEDLRLLERSNVDFLFLPDYSSIYPDAFTYKILETHLSEKYCGAFRPGHFTGMLTIVLKLLNIVQPTHAYFGLKDYQQYSLVKKMKEAFFIPSHIVGVETQREPSGLALSSRNTRLSESDRIKASKIFQILKDETSIEQKKQKLIQEGFEVEYLEKLDDRLLVAVWLSGVRLIDNV